MGRFPGIDYQPDIWPDDTAAGENLWLQDDLARTKFFRNSSGADIPANSAVFIDETVATDTLGHHITISTAGALGADALKFVGVTLRAIADTEVGEVVVAGLCYCEVAAGVAADDPLTIDNVTDGHLETGVAGTQQIVAVALEALAASHAGQAKIRVLPTM